MDETNEAQPELELLDFWATWCGPCKIMDPILLEIEEEYKDRLMIRKVNVDDPDNQPLMATFNILSVPTYILLKGNEVLASFIGAQHKVTMTEKIDEAFKTEAR